MPNRQELEQAIVVLEAQREVLGQDVVDVSLSILRRKLSSLRSSSVAEQYGHIVVLVADISDFTTISELMDAELVRDTINAIWDRLDAVIRTWGGEIDKHVGDGLIALFGVPRPQSDDAERAILAALDMQMELMLFNKDAMRAASGNSLSHPELRMRIGIDIGPVFFGKVGMRGDYTAVGDAVSRATRLQELAAIGGILISADVYSQVHSLFELESRSLIGGQGETGQPAAYLVKGEKPGAFRPREPDVAPGTKHMVGRQAELEQLQSVMQATIDSGRAQFLTIVGEAGVGKSSLLAEFEQSFKFLPIRIGLFQGRVQRALEQLPYALIRKMFLRFFGIHSRSKPSVAREKLVQGILQILPEDGSKTAAYYICQLLGFDFSDSPYLRQLTEDAGRIREHVYEDIVELFSALCRAHPLVTLLLEDVECADEKSLDLLDHIYESCQDLPLLIVCTGRPALRERRPWWQTLGSTSRLSYRTIGLEPLSAIDSRHLIAQSIPGPSRLPLTLTELILERTHGNPAGIAEYTQLLIQSEVIIRDSNQWRVQQGKLTDIHKLPTLTTLLKSHWQELPPLQQAILQRASVVGSIFWKSAVLPANDSVTSTSSVPDKSELETAMNDLVQQGVIFTHLESEFAGQEQFEFRYQNLCELAYRSISTPARREFHAQTAAWLIVNCDPYLSEYAGPIAHHLEKAGDTDQATEWYSRAGAYAKARFAYETAIRYYRQAISLLPDDPQSAPWRAKLNGVLGELLRWQVRFTEAIAAYQEMLRAARLSDNDQAEVGAIIGMFMAQISLGDHAAALATSRQAEHLAREASSPSHLAMALAAKAWALIHLDDLDTSLDMAQEALALSTGADSAREIAYSSALIGGISRIQQWYEQAAQATEKALILFRELGDVIWETLMLGNLGHIAYARHDYEIAADYYRSSLSIATDIGDHFGTIRCLRKLGEIAQAMGQFQETVRLYEKAFVRAEKSRNIDYCAHIATDLGWLHLGRLTNPLQRLSDIDRDIHAQQAQTWLERALFWVRDRDVPVVTISAKSGLACLLLEFMQPEQALTQARAAFELARKTLEGKLGREFHKWVAICWRVMGLVASELPPQELPILIDGRAYDATSCFIQSLHAFSVLGRGVEAEFARSLQSWADYELREGNKIQGQFLWSRAKEIFGQIGMEHEANLMDQAQID